ncbi:hypothetical protein SAMN05216391_1412 [Lachnospiraceae bacterium KHCPX20]|nr:hypothetical protein SAMN05216391_1412 [Lachnospiraceae bacterium KHCPX20]
MNLQKFAQKIKPSQVTKNRWLDIYDAFDRINLTYCIVNYILFRR